MKKIVKIAALTGILFALLHIINVSIWQRHQLITPEGLATFYLDLIKDDLKLWKLSDESDNHEIKKALALSMLKKLSFCKIPSLRVADLKKDTLEVIIVLSENPEILRAAENQKLFETTTQELSLIKDEVKVEITRIQRENQRIIREMDYLNSPR